LKWKDAGAAFAVIGIECRAPVNIPKTILMLELQDPLKLRSSHLAPDSVEF